MERIKCSVRSVRDDDRSMLVLLAEETRRWAASQGITVPEHASA